MTEPELTYARSFSWGELERLQREFAGCIMYQAGGDYHAKVKGNPAILIDLQDLNLDRVVQLCLNAMETKYQLVGEEDVQSYSPALKTKLAIAEGRKAMGWDQEFGKESGHTIPGKPHLRRYIGVSTVMQGTAIPNLDMGDAGIKINGDDSFNFLVGATDLGTGCSVSEEMRYDANGQPRARDQVNYHIFRADEMPEIRSIFVQTCEETGPYGAKAVVEILMDGAAPAIGKAVLDACGVNVLDNPLTPERIWQVMKHNMERKTNGQNRRF